MKSRHLKAVLLVAACFALCAGVLALAGCAGKGTLSSEIDEVRGSYTVTADDAGKGSAVAMVGGGFTVLRDQTVEVVPDISKGSLQLRLLDASGNKVLDEKISGHDSITFDDIVPGDYSISVTCNEDGTTGVLIVRPIDTRVPD